VRKDSLQRDFAEGCENSGLALATPTCNTESSRNANFTQCADRKSLQRSPFAIDEPSDSGHTAK